MAMQPGDVIACAFQTGSQGNTISLAPDQKICILDRKQEGTLPQHVPYVCTIRAHGKPGKDGEPTSYIVHADRILGLGDYDAIHAADFDTATLTLSLRYPTRFASLRRRRVHATITEKLLARGEQPRLELRLSHGNHHQSLELTREEALRRGIRFNHFVHVQPPKGPVGVPVRHPRPHRTPDTWQPGLQDHTTYLLLETECLVSVLLEVHRALDDELTNVARRRITEILALGVYDAIPMAGPDHVMLEHALACITRLTLPREALLADADAALARDRVALLAPGQLSLVAGAAGLAIEAEGEVWWMPVAAYVEACRHRRSGAWALCNRNLAAGRVELSTREVRMLLIDAVRQRRLQEPTPSLPDDLKGLVEELQRHAESVRNELAETPEVAFARGLVLEALPPCVAHALRAALHRKLTRPEAVNAEILLRRTGLAKSKVAQALAADVTPATSVAGCHERRRKKHKPIPCTVNQKLGSCRWQCPGTRNPLEYYAKAVQA